jgi:hypothetical protein
MDLTEALALVEAPRPTRFAMLLASGACERQDILQRIERDAFASVLKAYAQLCDSPVNCSTRHLLKDHVSRAKSRWVQALADLDRSMGRPELSEAA